MNEDKLTAQQVMQEMEWTFCKDNEKATRKETEAAVEYVVNPYRQQLRALNEFLDKTEFIQDTAHFSELGMHRADVIRKRFEQADAREKYLSEKLETAYEEIQEQARLLGMSAERELSLLAEIETKEKELAKYRKLAQLVLEARLPIKPVRNLDGSLENFTVRIAGKLHRCECGCNVFHKPDDKNLNLYECNACGQQFETE